MSYRRLTDQEIDDLRNEMKQAGEWMREELKRRRQNKHSDAQKSGTPADQKPHAMSP